MKIRTLSKLAVLLSLLVSIAVGIWIYSLYQTYSEMKDDTYIAQSMNSVILRINALSSEYLLYYQERASSQWKSAHQELGKILTDSKIHHVSAFVDLYKVIKSYERMQTLFSQLEKIKNSSTTAISIQQRKALGSQMLTSLQVMSQVTAELVNAVELKRKDIENQLFWLSFTIFITFVVILALSWLLIAYRIVIPVDKLKNYIVNIDAENLDKKYIVTRNDEVGELIDSFNRMADNLFNTTVSKQKLSNEIEERKRSEEELIKQTNLNKSVLENTANVVVVLDRSGKFIKFNHAAEEVTGYSRYELLYKPIWNYVIPEEQQDGIKKVFENLKDGNVDIAGNYENHWVTKDGDYRLFDWHNDVIRDSDNQVKYIVAIGHDITDKRKDEVEKQRMQRELEQSHKMEALGQLTGGIAHDFNNMLGIILGYTELVVNKVKDNNDLSIQNYLEQVITASNRAKELIAKMLTFSRIDSSDSQVIKVESLLDESINLMKSILPSTIKLEVAIENNLPLIVINPIQFQQVIMNLMINAKDAMDGVGTLTVNTAIYHSREEECSSCHQSIKGEWLEVIIKDDGSGMSDEVKERIFEPFFTTKKVGEGTGMGLSVIHGIVKGHNGHIIVKSEAGIGTSFHLLFPPAISETRLPSADEGEVKNIHGNGQRILIIDDQESIADVEYEILTSNGYSCIKKYDSKEALDLFLSDRNAFDLILTDQTMPNLSGLELIDNIRKNDIDIPIIIMTGYSDKIKSNKLDLENVTLLLKPVETKQLLINVERVLELKK